VPAACLPASDTDKGIPSHRYNKDPTIHLCLARVVWVDADHLDRRGGVKLVENGSRYWFTCGVRRRKPTNPYTGVHRATDSNWTPIRNGVPCAVDQKTMEDMSGVHLNASMIACLD
jgi:hypothetical protein